MAGKTWTCILIRYYTFGYFSQASDADNCGRFSNLSSRPLTAVVPHAVGSGSWQSWRTHMSLVLDCTPSLTMAGSHSERHSRELMFPPALDEHIELHFSVLVQFCVDKGSVVSQCWPTAKQLNQHQVIRHSFILGPHVLDLDLWVLEVFFAFWHLWLYVLWPTV